MKRIFNLTDVGKIGPLSTGLWLIVVVWPRSRTYAVHKALNFLTVLFSFI